MVEPDLHPLYPAVPQLSSQVSSQSGLNPTQKARLVAHCLIRSCIFGDFTLLQFLLNDPQTRAYADLGFRDEDGVNLISLAIQGFGGDADRDIDREECVRLLASQGADMSADKGDMTLAIYIFTNFTRSWLDATALCGPSGPTYLGFISNDPWLLSICANRKEGHSS